MPRVAPVTPACMIEECDGWPSVGFTRCCNECIKDPAKVSTAAYLMQHNRARFTQRDRNDSCYVSWLGREPNGANLKFVYELIQADPEKYNDLRYALEIARTHYWETQKG